MADTFLEEATSVKENDPYEVAAAGQVLAADGLGGVEWATQGIFLAQQPPFTEAVAPFMFVWEDEPLEVMETRDVNLTNIVPNASSLKAAVLMVHSNTSGGDNPEFVLSAHPYEVQTAIFTNIADGLDRSAVIVVPLDDGRFQIKLNPASAGLFVFVDVTFICGFR